MVIKVMFQCDNSYHKVYIGLKTFAIAYTRQTHIIVVFLLDKVSVHNVENFGKDTSK